MKARVGGSILVERENCAGKVSATVVITALSSSIKLAIGFDKRHTWIGQKLTCANEVEYDLIGGAVPVEPKNGAMTIGAAVVGSAIESPVGTLDQGGAWTLAFAGTA